jgi:hypothetical protein
MPDSNIPNGLDRAARRAAANKANAQHSTGPRTEAGKQRTRLNALRHGLTGQTVVLPTEDHAAYQRHSQSFLDEYQPQGATESQLVQSMIDSSWRINRAAAVETNLFSLGITEMEDRIPAGQPDADSALAMAMAFREHARAFSQISMYSQRLARQFERALEQLRALQEERRTREHQQLFDAATIFKVHKEDGLPYNPAEDGFVFSNEDIETYIHRSERLDDAIERACAT